MFPGEKHNSTKHVFATLSYLKAKTVVPSLTDRKFDIDAF